jgi:enoyl-CoA hydratase/carnithine racemase
VSAEQLVVIEGGGVLDLVLSRPERRNALSREMLAGLAAAVRGAGPGTRAIVLSGAGGTFSAGADFAELTGTEADVAFDDAVGNAVAAIADADCPVVAAIDGPCMGAALDLALACDVRIAAVGASFEIPAVRLGLLYNPAAVARMHAVLPRQSLVRLLVMGERLGARQALEAGLVAEVVQDGSAREAIAARAAAVTAGPALHATKQLLRDLDHGPCDLEAWEAPRRRLLSSPERRSAIEAARLRHAGAATR